jgi:hypothetical protein
MERRHKDTEWGPGQTEPPVISLEDADLSGTDLSYANLSGADLEGADLSGADLSVAQLSDTWLLGADLSGADLSAANLHEAFLISADLTDADLRDADLSGAFLGAAEGVTEKELEQAASSLAGATMPDSSGHAGLYDTSQFKPELSLLLGDRWRLWIDGETTDILNFSTGPNGGELCFTTPLQVFDPSNLSERKMIPAPKNADEWASWFQEHPSLETSEPVQVSVGGASGVRIDLMDSSRRVPLYRAGPKGPTVGSYDYTGQKTRLVIVDVKGEPVVIHIIDQDARFDFFPQAQEVLDTVIWGEP